MLTIIAKATAAVSGAKMVLMGPVFLPGVCGRKIRFTSAKPLSTAGARVTTSVRGFAGRDRSEAVSQVLKAEALMLLPGYAPKPF
jgi:hypothetical protein